VHVNLRGGQADAGRGVHGFGHVADEPAHGIVHHFDRCGDGVQTFVGIAKNVQNCHKEACSI
jgi:hypothetical protein